jgi:hypothetical protein
MRVGSITKSQIVKRQGGMKMECPVVAGYRGGMGIGGWPLLDAPSECLLCRRLPLLDEVRERVSTEASFSAMLKKREKNGFLPVPE